MINNSTFILPTLTAWHKKKYLNYATQVLEAQHQMTSLQGKNILHYTLKEKRRFVQMDHYPNDDRIDRNTGAQYFYHCHRENMATTEHGHFHCFIRTKQIPKQMKPATIPERDKSLQRIAMTHLIGISMSQTGLPIRLFTVNRWVTTETWYDGKHTPKLIKKFKITLNDDPYWQILDRWVEGIIHLFTPQIIWLQQQRDLQLQTHLHKKKHEQDYNIFFDYELEELSELDIDLKQQVEWIIS